MTHFLNFISTQIWVVCTVGSILAAIVTGEIAVINLGLFGGVLFGILVNEMMDGIKNEGVRVVDRD